MGVGGGVGWLWGYGGYRGAVGPFGVMGALGGGGLWGAGTPLTPPLFPPPQFADIMQKIEDYIARQPRAAEGNGGGGGGVLG